MRTGDLIATAAQPIAKGIDRILGTDVQNCGGCKQMQNNLNQGMSLADAVIARWFSGKQSNGGKPMGRPYVVTEQFVIEDAESTRDAIAKHLAGESEAISLNAQVRPQPPGQSPRPQQQSPGK
jgi:hypothetical protein